MQDLTGKTAFITGGASGIGFAMAEAFLKEGMKVVIADIDDAALAEAKTRLKGDNAVLAIQLDVTDRDQFAAVADQVETQMGPVHVLCNNAGVYRGGVMDEVTYNDWDWIMGVNVGGVVNGVQTFIERIKAHGQGGHIVNTASMAGIMTSPGLGVYNTSKFASIYWRQAREAAAEFCNWAAPHVPKGPQYLVQASKEFKTQAEALGRLEGSYSKKDVDVIVELHSAALDHIEQATS